MQDGEPREQRLAGACRPIRQRRRCRRWWLLRQASDSRVRLQVAANRAASKHIAVSAAMESRSAAASVTAPGRSTARGCAPLANLRSSRGKASRPASVRRRYFGSGGRRGNLLCFLCDQQSITLAVVLVLVDQAGGCWCPAMAASSRCGSVCCDRRSSATALGPAAGWPSADRPGERPSRCRSASRPRSSPDPGQWELVVADVRGRWRVPASMPCAELDALMSTEGLSSEPRPRD